MSTLVRMLADEYNWQAMEQIHKHAKAATLLLFENAYSNKSNRTLKTMEAIKAFEALSDAIETIHKLRSE